MLWYLYILKEKWKYEISFSKSIANYKSEIKIRYIIFKNLKQSKLK